jgi:hypothetical protein
MSAGAFRHSAPVESSGRWARIVLVAVSLVAVTLGSQQALAGGAENLFDSVSAIKKVAPSGVGPTQTDEATCTYYQDLMVRVAGTDTPAPDGAVIVPISGAASIPACDEGATANGRKLASEGYGFLGRKGPYLLFAASDPNGASAVKIFDAVSGAAIYADGLSPDDNAIRSLSLDNSALHIRFQRAVNAPCSIAQNTSACWARMIAAKMLPRALATQVPSPDICKTAYAASKAPVTDASVVLYEVDMMLDRSGKAHVLSRGATGCTSQP